MDPNQSSPGTEPPPKEKISKAGEVLLGLMLTVVLHFLQTPLLAFNKPWILFFGITQLFYIVPAIYFLNKHGQTWVVRGLIIGASITFVLGIPFAGLAIICASNK